jgi:hypothetical protein
MANMTCSRIRELASGFVLGALDADEMVAVQDHLDSCRLPHPEIDDLGGVLPYLAASLEPVEPPVWLRESVIAAARGDLSSRGVVGEPSELRGTGKPLERRTSTAQPLLVAAASPVSIVSLAAARASRRRRAMVWFGRVAAASLILVVAGYAAVVQTGVGKPSGTDDIVNFIQADTRSAVLVAFAHGHAGGLAVLEPSGNIRVQVNHLSPPQGDEAYVAWLTTDNGVLSKVGSLTVDDSGVGRLNVSSVPSSESLWISVYQEPTSKVTQPTGSLIVSGTLSQ